MTDIAGTLKAFENFPIIQSALALLIFLAGLYVLIRGSKDGRSGPAVAPGSVADTNMTAFSGPAVIIDRLREIANSTEETVEVLKRMERQQLIDSGRSERREPRR